MNDMVIPSVAYRDTYVSVADSIWINCKKIIVVSLLSTGLSWLLSATQPDMMNVMMTYNPVLFLLFTASWTAGMAAMMFPAIVPVVLLYNRLIAK